MTAGPTSIAETNQSWLGEVRSWLIQQGFVTTKQIGAQPVSYRKTTSKTVNTTTTATDLLNGEITIAAAALGTTGAARLTAWGDWLQNSGGSTTQPRLQLKLGSSTLFDTGTAPAGIAAGATRYSWSLTANILNVSASSQVADLNVVMMSSNNSLGSTAFTTGAGQIWMAGTGAVILMNGVTTASESTASACALVLNVINGSASATYETKLFGALVEIS